MNQYRTCDLCGEWSLAMQMVRLKYSTDELCRACAATEIDRLRKQIELLETNPKENQNDDDRNRN